MKPIGIERHCTLERIHDDLELVHSMLWLSIDSLEYHNLSQLSHVKQALHFSTERIWEQMKAAKQLHQEACQEFMECQKQGGQA